jgi:hypothetical protein
MRGEHEGCPLVRPLLSNFSFVPRSSALAMRKVLPLRRATPGVATRSCPLYDAEEGQG